jgi:hypothetical protein
MGKKFYHLERVSFRRSAQEVQDLVFGHPDLDALVGRLRGYE